MTVTEILNKAADLIEQRGWHQGWYINDCGGLCATGAMYTAAGVQPLPEHAPAAFEEYDGAKWSAASRAWDAFGAFLGRFVPTWNDEEGRTKEEVVSALRAAAEAARAETLTGPGIRVGQKFIEKRQADGVRRVIEITRVEDAYVAAEGWYQDRTDAGWVDRAGPRRRTRLSNSRLHWHYQPLDDGAAEAAGAET